FKTKEEAEKAYENPWSKEMENSAGKKPRTKKFASEGSNSGPVLNSLAVDAACSGNPGIMEYRGVHVETDKEWFRASFKRGTNNIGEFLGIVHGLAELNRRNLNIPVYTDSSIALGWVKKKKCGSKLQRTPETEELFQLIERAEKWLKNNQYSQLVLKWDTKTWGEIPADFGRK
ncbi:MAG: RNase H family protein, partial [Bacteroidota bacterium]